MRRTPEEEQARQLKTISYQLAPGVVLFKVGFWLSVGLIALGLMSMPFLRFR